jgi:peptidoglycan hydrolase-like protein with peptidoglycan-binding domain
MAEIFLDVPRSTTRGARAAAASFQTPRDAGGNRNARRSLPEFALTDPKRVGRGERPRRAGQYGPRPSLSLAKAARASSAGSARRVRIACHDRGHAEGAPGLRRDARVRGCAERRGRAGRLGPRRLERRGDPSDDDGDGEDETELRLFRFAFDRAQFRQVPLEPSGFRVPLDPSRFHHCEVSAKLEIVTQALSYPTAKTDRAYPKTAVRRARLLGMLFDADKTFLLPQALPGIKTMVEMQRAYPEAKLVAVGHATSDEVLSGGKLALARARALKAYLTRDIEIWHGEFSHEITARARWGTREVQIMLSAVPEGAPHYTGYPSGLSSQRTTAAVKAFQGSKGLKVDGKVGPKTLKALIGDYMDLEGTTLEKGTDVLACGCEGHVDDDPAADGSVVDDRRVDGTRWHEDRLGLRSSSCRCS